MDGNGNNLVTLTINGVEVTVPAGTLLTDAAEQAGFKIPQFCAHRWLEPLGACRMCLVRIEKMAKLQTACSTVVREGMVVTTESDEIRAARAAMLEFHLLNHPLECPVCDRGGECDLQDLTELYGCTTSRYVEDKQVRPDAMLTPFLHMNYKRCILCKRCVRYCEEVSGSNLLKVNERGAWSHITNFGGGVKDYFAGNTIEVCPVGAITSEVSRFRGRAWELTRTRTVCNQCSVGCAVEVHTRLGELVRVVPAPLPEVNDSHICDRGRFAVGYVNTKECPTRPTLGRGDAARMISWDEAEKFAAARISEAVEKDGADAVGILAGGGLTNEDFMHIRLFAHTHLGTSNFFLGEGLIDIQSNPMPLLHSLFFDGTNITEILKADLIVPVGCDLMEEAPVLGLRIQQARKRGARLISLCANGRKGYWKSDAHILYEPARFIEAAAKAEKAVRGEVDAGSWRPLVDALGSAKHVAIIYGQELLRHRNADQHLLALLKLKYATHEMRRKQGADCRCTLTPVFRGANAVGAIIFNNLEFLAVPEGHRPARPHATYRGILEKAAAGEIKLLYLIGVNPLMTFTDRSLVERALEKAEFVIAQDVLPNETTQAADLVLPVASWAHKDGTYFNLGWRLQRLNRTDLVPAVPTDLEILKRICVRMGKHHHHSDAAAVFNEMARVTQFMSHLTFETIPETGSVFGFDADDEAVRRMAEEVAAIELDPPAPEADSEYPYTLVPKQYLFRNSPRMRYSPKMHAAVPEAVALMHPGDLSSLGLADGTEAIIESRHGSIQLALAGAGWVQRGSVIVNNYLPGAPTNRLVSVEDEITYVRVRAAQ